MKPKVLVLKADGINCDEELAFAFKLAGGQVETVHINDLRSKKKKLSSYQILAIPGGFSYGDDIVSGKILAVELTSFLSKELKKFIKRKNTLVIGICNGFQVLVRTGLLPFNHLGKMDVTLTNNDSGHFECRWIKLKIQPSKCPFLNNEAMKQFNNVLSFQVAHGEGKFFANSKVLKDIEKKGLVVFRYVDENGRATQKYPQNPNGSLNAIAGICDPTGRILGLMPHPERYVLKEQYPNWRSSEKEKPQGLQIFEGMIKYVKEN